MTLSDTGLREIVAELASRPGHEKVRVLVSRLLVDGLGAQSPQLLFEMPLPEVRGRLDALLGRTVIEFKRDLRAERREAETKLTDYLGERERQSGQRYVGIATDGADLIAYELRDGGLATLSKFRPSVEKPRDLLLWLDSVVAVRPELECEPEVFRQELGRDSPTYEAARARLARLWDAVQSGPSVRLKRQLWADLLQFVYGSSVDRDDLFFQHTYLTIVAKALATRLLGLSLPLPSGELLSGKRLQDAGLSGAIEPDFFDWVLDASGGDDLVSRIALQVNRFRLDQVQHDVLKTLYESLIDPEQRHDLGEYYTPDWLTARMCTRVIDAPLTERVLDPACGSGTFLFHAVRRFLAAADESGIPNPEALARCCNQVLGIDVHPVAVLIARVTYLLAFGTARLTDSARPGLSIPVYLGDSLQWNTERFLAQQEVIIRVPDGPQLQFPGGIASSPAVFDKVLETMLSLSRTGAPAGALQGWLDRQSIGSEAEREQLAATYEALRALQEAGRNHIWGYVVHNLSRPIWLSAPDQKADVIIGNPPWLSYRYMASNMQERFRGECLRRGIWAGGRVATHQDLSAYFFVRCLELYGRHDSAIAFVMPYAALNRAQFAGFLTGQFGSGSPRRREIFLRARFLEAWAFDQRVQPLFPVPSCVLIAKRDEAGPRPDQVTECVGNLPQRDATPEEARAALHCRQAPWPQAAEFVGGSPYRESFRQGATMVPRILCVVERAQVAGLGDAAGMPQVRSRRTRQEKRPWKELGPLQGRVEAQFLRPLYLGESVAPYRLLDPVLAVIPWEDTTKQLLDAEGALRHGFPHLGSWMGEAERLWATHGGGRLELQAQWDYYGKLSAQFPVRPLRVLYAASGTLPASALISDSAAVVEHKLYWAGQGTSDEGLSLQQARYLEAILNSDTARQRVAGMQSRGQWGARDFDKLMFELPIPAFETENPLHRRLADAAEEAERIAAGVAIPPGMYFVRARELIRRELQEAGIAQRIDELVKWLLGSEPLGIRRVQVFTRPSS